MSSENRFVSRQAGRLHLFGLRVFRQNLSKRRQLWLDGCDSVIPGSTPSQDRKCQFSRFIYGDQRPTTKRYAYLSATNASRDDETVASPSDFETKATQRAVSQDGPHSTRPLADQGVRKRYNWHLRVQIQYKIVVQAPEFVLFVSPPNFSYGFPDTASARSCVTHRIAVTH